MKNKLPPSEFSNQMEAGFNWETWRQSREWKFFVAGYNAAVKEANQAVLDRYDMGETKERLFGKDSQ